MIRLVALLGCMASSSIAHNFTAIPGFLPADAPNASPQQNVTLASAEQICGAVDACIGFSFRSPTATPSGVVEVHFKALYDVCDDSRFRHGICPSDDGTDWHVRIPCALVCVCAEMLACPRVTRVYYQTPNDCLPHRLSVPPLC